MSSETKTNNRSTPVNSFVDLLSKQERATLLLKIRKLSVLDIRRSMFALATDWAIIATVVTLAISTQSFLAAFFAVVIVGTRQHALCLLMHDGAHNRLFTNPKLNFAMSDFFCAYPLFLTTTKYRDSHLAHHRFLNTEEDPDWNLRRGKKEWEFPKSRTVVTRILTKQLLGLNTIHMLSKLYRFGVKNRSVTHVMPMSRTKKVARVLYYLVLFGALTAVGGWKAYLLFWVFPAFTILPFLLRLRSLSEHFGLPWKHELDSSRNVHANIFEKFFFVPHNGEYHLDHHLYPSVPFYNLPALHVALESVAAYREKAWNSDGYLSRKSTSVLSDLKQSP